MHGLYAVTDNSLISPDHFIDTVEQALRGGATAIQYRDKRTSTTQRIAQANDLFALCRSYHVPLIINDDVALTKQIGANGVHLGKDDSTIAAARAFLGNQVMIGTSCYNQLHLAQQAVATGADYVAFGRFFPSHTKPQAVAAPLILLTMAREMLACPIVAIGGITPDNATSVIAAGADCLAVIQGIFGQKDVQAAARCYAQLFF